MVAKHIKAMDSELNARRRCIDCIENVGTAHRPRMRPMLRTRYKSHTCSLLNCITLRLSREQRRIAFASRARNARELEADVRFHSWPIRWRMWASNPMSANDP